MGFFGKSRRARAALLVRSAQLPATKPPARSDVVATPENSTSLHSVYRAVEIILNAGAQLSIDAKKRSTFVANPPAILRKPSLSIERDDFIEEALMSLALDGNIFWLKHRVDGVVLEVEQLNPFLVHVARDPETGVKYFQYQGKKYSTADIIHRARMKLPGQVRGRSVIQAAREDMEAALQTRKFAGGVFDENRVINGIVSSEQALNGDDAKVTRYTFDRRDPETGEPLDDKYTSTIRVLGKGMKYQSLTLDPKDAQWLEAQAFNVNVITRMFGVPSTLMLASPEGSSMTYQNVDQEWLAFVRFTLGGYLRKIESAFTELLPIGQTAVFNIEGLLRSDTLTRYRAHGMAIGKWMTADEIRAIENLEPLTDEQREQLKSTKATPDPIAVETTK